MKTSYEITSILWDTACKSENCIRSFVKADVILDYIAKIKYKIKENIVN